MARLPYWWAWKIHRGHPVIRGWYPDEATANREGMRDLRGDFEVTMLYTRDPDRARGIIKDMILRRSQNLDLALSRVRHQPIKGEGEG
jgi:hypothetical protein